MGKMISFKRPDGQDVDGYLAEPANGKAAPGVVEIQEWWGLNDQIKGVADKTAAAGYRALVPDLYRGKLALAANEAEHLMNDLNFGDAAGLTLRGAMAREGMARELLCCDIDGNSEARGRAGRSTRAQAAGATVPLHHPAGVGRRESAAQRRRSGGAQAQDPLGAMAPRTW